MSAEKSKGASALYYIVAFVFMGAAAFLWTTGARYLDENNGMQREAKIALEDYIAGGREFPVGEYVSLNLRWVIGPFATETSTSTTNGIKATSGVAYYYFAVLEDETVMVIKSKNTQDRAVLDRMSDWLISVDGYPMNGETFRVQGKLRKMTDQKLTELYSDNLYSIFGLSSNDPAVRYLVLDTAAGREMLYLIICGCAAAAIAALVIAHRTKKKKALAAQPAEAAPADSENGGRL